MFEANPEERRTTTIIEVNRFPDITAVDKDETNRRLLAMSSELRQAFIEHGNVAPEDEDDVEAAYKAYELALEKSLPPGYSLKETLSPESDFWRGTDPLKLMSLLAGKGNSLEIKSDYPNVAKNWEIALSFGLPEKSRNVPFIMAVGFHEPEEWNVKKESLMGGRKVFCADGKINFLNVSEIVIRLKNKNGIVSPRFYKLVTDQVH